MEKKTKKLFICDFKNWEKVFTTKYSMLRHINIHKKKSFKWDQWNKQFSFKQNLVEHQFIHTGELPYTCGVNGCTQKFRQRGKLSIHRQSHLEYRKKEYRSHAVINEDEKYLMNNFHNASHLTASYFQNQLSHQSLSSLPPLTSNCILLNQVVTNWGGQTSSPKNIVIMSQSVSNRTYEMFQGKTNNVGWIETLNSQVSSQAPLKPLPKISLLSNEINSLNPNPTAYLINKYVNFN